MNGRFGEMLKGLFVNCWYVSVIVVCKCNKVFFLSCSVLGLCSGSCLFVCVVFFVV